MKYTRSAAEIASTLQKQFGYVVVASDDVFAIGEQMPHLGTTRGVLKPRAISKVTATVTGETTYEDYRTQAVAAGFGDTVSDCMAHYYKVELKESGECFESSSNQLGQ